ncbi:DUF5906 domain-containing protein [Planktomarina temperata]|nr:DUF5906 domain-containing protein [bacterium]MDC0130756.1 DUF5906 domain-containing protein [Planktomarina temperata]
MLSTDKKANDDQWELAHRTNKLNKPRSIRQSFECEINAKIREGFEYDPFQFQQQWMWLKAMFYKVPQGTQQICKRRFDDGTPDDTISTPEIHATLERKYGDTLHPCIQEWAIHYIGTTAGVRYNPATTAAFFEVEHTQYRNSYCPPRIQKTAAAEERPPEWQEYLDRLMPRDQLCTTSKGLILPQQKFFEAIIAQRIQQPEHPPLFCLLLRGEHGTGKGYWMDNILKRLIGETNLVVVTLADVQKQFISDIYSSTVVHIEEINDSRGKSGEKMKKLITEEQSRVEGKYANAYVANKYFNIVASSNVHDPIRIEQNDRRYFVPVYSKHLNAPDETKQFFASFTDWLEEQDGLQAMANYLHSLNVDNFDFRFPPHTAAKSEIMETTTRGEDNTTKAAMELKMQFDDCVVSLNDVVSQWLIKQSDAKHALRSAGFTSVKRRWAGDPTYMWVHKSLVPEDGDWSQVGYRLFTRRESYNPQHWGEKKTPSHDFIEVE